MSSVHQISIHNGIDICKRPLEGIGTNQGEHPHRLHYEVKAGYMKTTFLWMVSTPPASAPSLYTGLLDSLLDAKLLDYDKIECF